MAARWTETSDCFFSQRRRTLDRSKRGEQDKNLPDEMDDVQTLTLVNFMFISISLFPRHAVETFSSFKLVRMEGRRSHGIYILSIACK